MPTVRPSSEAMFFVSGWQDGVGNVPAHQRLVPTHCMAAYDTGYTVGVSDRKRKWETARRLYPNTRLRVVSTETE